MKSCLLFVHIPKCAGSTLSRILIKYTSPARYIQLDSARWKTQVEEYLALSEEEKQKVDLILGHNSYVFREKIAAPVSCITFLRNPIDRVISLYYFIKNRPDHRLHNQLISQRIGLKEFLTTEISPVIENHMTSIISRRKISDIRENPQDALETAINHLEKDFFHVGIVEHFDLSLVMLKNKLNWDDQPFYLRENVNKSRQESKLDVDDDTAEIIRNKNRLDYQLFEYASQRLFREAEASHESLAEQVAQFQKENQRFKTWKLPQRKIKDQLSALKKK